MYPVWYLILMRLFWKQRVYLVRDFLIKGRVFEISLAGVYQKENAVLALNALEELDQTWLAYHHGTAKGRASAHKLEGKIYGYQ